MSKLLALFVVLPALAAAEPSFYRFDPGHAAPVFNRVFHAPGSALYLLIDGQKVRFFTRDGARAHELVLLKPAAARIEGRRVELNFPLRLLQNEVGREDMVLELGETVVDPVRGTLRRRTLHVRHFLQGRGSVDDPPLTEATTSPVLLLSELDPDALQALTAASGTVINSRP